MIFKVMRERKGLTQQAAADELGVAQTTVAMWEIGAALPRAILLPQIAKLYGCTIDELLKKEK